jgi:uncharacterized protein (TIGR02266 family)
MSEYRGGPDDPMEVRTMAAALSDAEDQTQTPEGRVFARVGLNVEVNMRSENTFFTGFSENISEGGLFVATEAPYEIGERLDLSLSVMGDESKTLTGIVRWVRPGGTSGGLPAGMGVQFVDLDDAVLRALQGFVDSGAKDTLFFDLD